MTFAAAYEPAPAIWGVGRLVIDGAVTPWLVSEADVDDEAEAQTHAFRALGVGPGDLVLIVSLLSQAVHVVPLEKAAGQCGALYSSADATPSDALRVVALVQQLAPRLVLGLTGSVLDGIVELGGDGLGTLAPVPVIVSADENARTRLAAVGLRPRRWVRLGPTSAFETSDNDSLAYDARRWHMEEDEGELLATNLAPRLTPARRMRTGVRGRVTEPGAVQLG